MDGSLNDEAQFCSFDLLSPDFTLELQNTKSQHFELTYGFMKFNKSKWKYLLHCSVAFSAHLSVLYPLIQFLATDTIHSV